MLTSPLIMKIMTSDIDNNSDDDDNDGDDDTVV